MEEQEEKEKKKKVMALWLKLVIVFASIAAVSVPVALVFSNKAPAVDVVDVSFTAFYVNYDQSEELVKDEFTYSTSDLNATKRATGGVNKQIDTHSYIKLVYDFKNKSGEMYLVKIDFYGVENKNCNVFYQINDGLESLMSEKEILAQENQDFTITVNIKVDDGSVDSKFSGNILLSLAAI